MRPTFPLLLSLMSGCTLVDAVVDPCRDALDATPDACAGVLVVDPAAAPPAFDLEGLGSADPSMVQVSLVDPEWPCGGGVRLWELRGVKAEDLPIRYGDAPDGSRTWVNPVLSPDGELIPLDPGETYEVAFFAKSRVPGDTSGSAPVGWSAVFVAGEPDSALLSEEACP